MSKLKDDLAQILQEKQEKIIPENIKSGVQIFDVVGTYEGEGSSSGVKLFETEEEMQADTTAKEGDLAVVYRNEVNNMTADSQTQYITFPETVTLPGAITESYYCRLRATDPSKMFDGNIMLDQNSFRFDGFTDTGMIRVMYQSDDGITYTRQEFMGDNGELTNPVDLGTEIHCEMQEEWNDNCGYFMQVGGNVFEGLFEYETTTEQLNNDYIVLSNDFGTKLIKSINIESKEGPSISNTYEVYAYINSFETSNEIKHGYQVYIPKDYTLIYNFRATKGEQCRYINGLIYTQDNKMYIWGNNFHTDNSEYYNDISCIIETYENKTLVSTNTYTYKQLLDMSILLRNTGSYWLDYYYSEFNLPEEYSIENLYGYKTKIKTIQYDAIIKKYEGEFINLPLDVSSTYLDASACSNELIYNAYIYATSQLTTTKDLVYNSTYYGKDGVNEGTLTQNVSNSFADINAEIYYNIQQTYNNMEPRVLTDSDKTIDKNIYFIPTKLDGTTLLDTSQVTNMSNMFENCSNLIVIPLLNTNSTINMSNMFHNCDKLEIIPLLDTSSITDMSYMFSSCTNLDNIPLLNTVKVNTMRNMFYFCRSLTNLPEFNTTSVKNMSYMLYHCENLTSIPTIDTSNVTDMSYMFYGCKNLMSLPELNTTNVTTFKYTFEGCASLTSIPALNVAKCKNFQHMFDGCTNLQNVPVYDVTVAPVNITDMFLNCPSLSDDSLNNILQTCINSDSDTSSPNGYKTLKDIGLSEEQATKCTTLSNYSAFTAAGWTTGY